MFVCNPLVPVVHGVFDKYYEITFEYRPQAGHSTEEMADGVSPSVGDGDVYTKQSGDELKCNYTRVIERTSGHERNYKI